MSHRLIVHHLQRRCPRLGGHVLGSRPVLQTEKLKRLEHLAPPESRHWRCQGAVVKIPEEGEVPWPQKDIVSHI